MMEDLTDIALACSSTHGRRWIAASNARHIVLTRFTYKNVKNLTYQICKDKDEAKLLVYIEFNRRMTEKGARWKLLKIGLKNITTLVEWNGTIEQALIQWYDRVAYRTWATYGDIYCPSKEYHDEVNARGTSTEEEEDNLWMRYRDNNYRHIWY